MKSLWIVAVLGLVGCASSAPIGEDESDRPEIQLVFEAWDQAGMPDVSSCGAQHWARVSPTEFADVCGEASCAHSGKGSCMLACTPTDDVATAYWDASAHPNDVGAENFARAHEQLHAWLACTTGSADVNHTNVKVWSLLNSIERDLRAM